MLATRVLALLAAGTAVAAPTSSSSSSSAPSSPTSDPAALNPRGYTSPQWIDAFKKAQEVVAGMTLAEKVNFADLRPDLNGCSGLTYHIASANIFGICFSDAPVGAQSCYNTHFPTELTTGGTWDKKLVYARAEAMGKEFVDAGVHAGLSIVAGPIGRSPRGGRNWENWSPDAYFTDEATKLSVEGFQKSGVVGTVKHFLAKYVLPSRSYRWPDELGFGGYVMSDWGVVYDTIPSALNGTDYVAGVGGQERLGREVGRPHCERHASGYGH
ncbi:hypothetical protein JCM11641_003424 [Rhodosporidiobolus odoratus]